MTAETISTVAAAPDAVRWSGAKRFLFRFAFCYFTLYICPIPTGPGLLGLIPGSSFLSQAIARGWMKVLPWFAIHIFRLSGAAVSVYRPSGTGDKTLDYVLVLVFLSIAAIASIVWTALDARRPNYVVLDAWLRLAIRYFLVYQMIVYGVNKVIPVQFTQPRLTDLLTPTGMRSRTGEFWTLMGISTPYVIFSGVGELLAAGLLMFQRTRVIGAIVTFAVLSNVVALNFGYNVGVKLFSSHLLVMALFLVAPHAGALKDFFVLNKPARLANADPLAKLPAPVRLAIACTAVILLAVFITTTARQNWSNYETIKSRITQTPLYGVYDVDAFVRDGRDVLPLTTDETRWKKVILQTPTGVVVQVMTDAWPWPWYRAAYDQDKKTLSLFDVQTRKPRGGFAYSQVDNDHVILDGTLDGQPLLVHLSRLDVASLPLLRDPFSWVHEVPPSDQ